MVSTTSELRRSMIRSGASEPLALPLAVWAALVASGASLVYGVLVATNRKRLDAAPLHGAIDPHLTLGVFVPIAIAAAAVLGVHAFMHLSWRRTLLAAWGATAVWAVALCTVRGWHRLTAPLTQDGDYLAVLDRVGSLPAFFATFVDRIEDYPVHVQGHPPGFVSLAWLLREVGLAGPAPVAVICVVVGAATAPLTLIVVRDVAGEDWARRSAPFVTIAPIALWIGTSADAFFAGVGASAVALLVVSTHARARRRLLFAALGGVAFGLTIFLSYGLVLLAVIPVVVAVRRRVFAPLLIASAVTIAVALLFGAAGFWWVDGLFATRERYLAGIASERPYALFLVANLSIVAIAVGPAVAIGVARLRDVRTWLIVGSAMAAVAIADVSGMSKSEVERIWLPFAPFLLVSAGSLVPISAVRERRDTTPGSPAASGRTMRSVRAALACQAGLAIAIESSVRTAW